MKRRDFIKQNSAAVGLASFSGVLFPLTASESNPQEPSRASGQISGLTGVAPEEIRSAQYLRRAQMEAFLSKPPVFVASQGDVKVSPMPLMKRISRKIVPQRGFCCLSPGGEALSSGNGAMNIEVAGNPFTEQIPFGHESLFTPRKKSLEAPKIANVFPEVRQMMLDGKYEEAIMLAYKEWQKNPVTRGFGGFGQGQFSMLLEFPKSKTVKDYLRTVLR